MDRAEYFVDKGLKFLKKGDPKTAFVQIAIARSFDSQNRYYFEKLGNFYEKVKDYFSAAVQYHKLIAENPENIQFLCSLARCYSKMGYNKKAFSYYDLAMNIDSSNKEVLEALGKLCYKQGYFEEAAEYFEKYILLNGYSKVILNKIALSYLNSENYSLAIETFNDYIKKYGPNSTILNDLAIAYFKVNDYISANIVIKKAIYFSGENIDHILYKNCAIIKFHLKKYKSAFKYYHIFKNNSEDISDEDYEYLTKICFKLGAKSLTSDDKYHYMKFALKYSSKIFKNCDYDDDIFKIHTTLLEFFSTKYNYSILDLGKLLEIPELKKKIPLDCKQDREEKFTTTTNVMKKSSSDSCLSKYSKNNEEFIDYNQSYTDHSISVPLISYDPDWSFE